MISNTAVRCRVAAVLIFVCAVQGAGSQETEPFRTRNLTPLVSIFGIPAWEDFQAATRFELTSELANHYRLSRRGEDTLILDGETWRSALVLRRGFGERWTAGIEIPHYAQSGGILDDVIDSWHSAFGLPDGGRNRREEGQLAFLLADESGPFYALAERSRGWGDVQLSVGRRVGADGGFLLKGTLKLATGDEYLMAGSGATDFGVTLMRSRRFDVGNRPGGFFWGVGAVVLGEPKRIRFDTEPVAVVGMVGGSLKPWPRMGLKAQLDVHSALYESRLQEIGDPGVQATIGGFRELGQRGVVEVAVNEDLAVSTSPDLVVHLTIKWTL